MVRLAGRNGEEIDIDGFIIDRSIEVRLDACAVSCDEEFDSPERRGEKQQEGSIVAND